MSKPKIYLLDDGDIIRSDDGKLPFLNEKTSLAEDLNQFFERQYGNNVSCREMFSGGFECRVLRPGQNQWMSGKIQFVLKLELDETETVESNSEIESPDSPLDEIRKLAES